MSGLFLTVLNMSLTASYVALAVIIVRLLLKKAPKVFSYALWAVVLFRLVCPVSFESSLSLIPVNMEPISYDIVVSQNPVVDTGIAMVDDTVNQQQSMSPVNPAASANPMDIAIEIAALVWILGIVVLLFYGIIPYSRLKHRISTATLVRDNIFETDRIQTPFILGLIKPRIYIPTDLSESERDYIIKHEQTHIRRYDNVIKPVASLALALHWFNPVIWLSYFLMIKDMEMSCDESVMKQSSEDIRASYSNSLLSLSIKQSGLLSPLAFGESNVKSRIKNVLNYKKPAFWVIILAVVAVIAALVGLAANPVNTFAYKNEALGFSLKFPADWEDKYIIEESEDNISIFSKKVYESDNGGGLLLSIERQIGELITEEDMLQAPVGQHIILQGNGYTYFTRIPSDVQYPPDDEELSHEYQALFEQITDISNSIALLGTRKPEAANEAYRVEGTSFFTVEIPGGWELKVLEDSPRYWSIYNGNNEVGGIELIPYYNEDPDGVNAPNDSILQEYLVNDEILRKVRITLNAKDADQGTMQKIKSSFKFTNGPYTVVDLLSTAGAYIAAGGERVFGQIDGFEMGNGNPVAVKVKVMKFIPDGPEDNNPNGFRIEDLHQIRTYPLDFGVRIAPFVAPNYHTYGMYEMPLLDETFIQKYRNYQDFYYDFIVGKDGQLKIILGHYIP